MKKLLVFSLLFVLLGCTHAQDEQHRIDLRFFATDSVGSASKTDVLLTGDKISVYGAVDGVEGYFLDNSTWTVGSDGHTLVPSVAVFYHDPKQAATFYAYFGQQSVPSDQSAAAELKKADLCWASASSTPSTAPVPLKFNHIFARLVVTCSQPTEKITVPNAFSGGSLDIRTGVFTNSTKSDVFTTQNELIVPAQTLSRLVLTSGGVEYVFDGSITLESGKTTTLNLTLNTATKTVSLSGSSVAAWASQATSGTPSDVVSNAFTLQWGYTPLNYSSVNKLTLTLRNPSGATKTVDAVGLSLRAGSSTAAAVFTFGVDLGEWGYPYTIAQMQFYSGSTLVQNTSTGIFGSTIYKPGSYVLGVKQNPVLSLSAAAPGETVPRAGKSYSATVTSTAPWSAGSLTNVSVSPSSGGAGATSVTVAVAATNSPTARTVSCAFTTSNSMGLTDASAVWSGTQERALIPGDFGYITTGSDGTGLPAGLLCVGIFGGSNGTVYAKGLYLDKCGSGTGTDPLYTFGYQGVDLGVGFNNTTGLANTNALTSSPAANYCRSKGAGWYLPAINQIWSITYSLGAAIQASFPAYSLHASGYYWSSTWAAVNMAYGQLGAAFDHPQMNVSTSLYVRCVREY